MADEQPADDLRSLLAGAFDESAASASVDAGEKPAPKAEAAPEKPAAEIEPEPKATDDRPRGPDGKFLKKEDQDADDAAKAKPDPKPAAKEEPKAEAKTEGDDKAPAKSDAKPSDDPRIARWSASDKAMFKLQSPEAQEFLLRRHGQIEAELTRRTQAIAELEKEYAPVQQLFAPHLDVLKQKNLTPQTVIRRWAEVETSLANGRGVDIIDGIVKAYNIDKGILARRLGFTSTPSGQASTETIPPASAGAHVDPAVLANSAAIHGIELPPQVTEELRQLREGLNAINQRDQSAKTQAALMAEQKVETEITNFKSAVTDKGELLHPYFDEVEPAMIALAQSYVARKQAPPPIADLYDMAVYANPSTRQALLATQRAAQEAKANEEARAKAASARRAASSVTGAPGTGQSTRPVRGELSLREQLEEAAADAAG